MPTELRAKDVDRLFRVPTSGRFRLKDQDTAWAGGDYFRDLSKDELKERAQAYLTENLSELAAAQQLLYATDRHSVLVVLQAMDAAGKDGTIKHVMSGLNPQGCQVHAFKAPSHEELDHDFLWRIAKALPERGRIGIFNRSYYEDVLVVRVHPELLEHQKLPADLLGKNIWKQRFEDINAFERHLWRNGTIIRKFFLQVSKKEQRKRFLERLDKPDKNWKFSSADLHEREYWNDYMKHFEEAIARTATKEAPWYVVPADHKWFTAVVVADAIVQALEGLDLSLPKATPAKRRELQAARRRLLAEG